MIRFYFYPTPNPAKVALFLEEVGQPYEVIPIDTHKGEQHTSEFRKINPNGKLPAIVDTDGPGGKAARVFDSTASAACYDCGVTTARAARYDWRSRLREQLAAAAQQRCLIAANIAKLIFLQFPCDSHSQS